MSSAAIPNQTLPAGANSFQLGLGDFFQLDGITGSLVKLSTNTKGKANALFVELYDAPNPGVAARTTPLTVANFLGYVDSGAYNGTIFHRLVPDFVLQGGGFQPPSQPQPPLGQFPPVPIPQGPAVLNEPGNTNARGTVAMAKLGGDPNSATNQFFFNLADNAGNLDNQNGGFTVFGRLVGNSLALLDRLASSLVVNGGGVFSDLPLQAYKLPPQGKPPRPLRAANYLTITTAARSGAFTYRVQAKGAQARVDPITGELSLRWAKPPTKATRVTVQATSVLNPRERFNSSFDVLPASAAPAAAGLIEALNLAGSDPLAPLVAFTDLIGS